MPTAYPLVTSTVSLQLDNLKLHLPISLNHSLSSKCQHPMNTETPEISIAEFRERYPLLFSDPSVDAIYCSRGWRDLLVTLCDTLQAHLDRHPDVSRVAVAQVKSKFGELHFFYDGGDSYCMGAVALAEQMSLKTCEQCGAPGKQIGGRWVSTLCPMHDGSPHAGDS